MVERSSLPSQQSQMPSLTMDKKMVLGSPTQTNLKWRGLATSEQAEVPGSSLPSAQSQKSSFT